MKKLIFLAAFILTVGIFVSCSKDDIQNTATVALAGDWYVTVDVADADGNIVAEDFNGGRCHMLTYNTAENVSNQLFVDDQQNLVGFKGIATSDVNNLTFSTPDSVENYYSSRYLGDKLLITNGKVVLNGGVQKNGSPSDSIYFEVRIGQDRYAASYGYDHYVIHGIRYSGLAENN